MEHVAQRLRTRDLTAIAACAALMAVCAWIAIPTDPPFTLQTLAVFLAVGLLGGRRGTIAVGIYLLMGALGILMGTTGGYIWGFLGSALVMWAMERILGTHLVILLLSMLLGLLVCYAFGTVWYVVVYAKSAGPISAAVALGRCVVPFILPDLCKLSAAMALSVRLRPHIHPRNS